MSFRLGLDDVYLSCNHFVGMHAIKLGDETLSIPSGIDMLALIFQTSERGCSVLVGSDRVDSYGQSIHV